jgi:uncharacterized protein
MVTRASKANTLMASRSGVRLMPYSWASFSSSIHAPGSRSLALTFASQIDLNYNKVTTNMELPVFSWDNNKNASNLAKHGVSFEAAKLVFDDPLHLSKQDRVENGEQRWQTIGLVADCLLLLVAHTWVDEDDGTEHIRIVSARRATKIERKVYEQST